MVSSRSERHVRRSTTAVADELECFLYRELNVDRLCTFADGELCRFDARRAAADNDDFFALELGIPRNTAFDIALALQPFGREMVSSRSERHVRRSTDSTPDAPLPIMTTFLPSSWASSS
jgi:hypothetical protein